jgi:hypothetical protein
MTKENKQKVEEVVEIEDNRSVFYGTKKGFANVFVYDTDMIELGFSKSKVETMTNGDVNKIFRDKLQLSKRVSGKSGYKKDLIAKLGLKEGASQSEINQKMLELLRD